MVIVKFLIVKYIISKIDKNIKVRLGKRLECDVENNIVYITFKKQNKIDNETFIELVKELNPLCKYNSLLMGILHEVGHCFTWDNEEEEQYNKDLDLLSTLYTENLLNAEDFNRAYVRMKMEKVATQWAVDFAMSNTNLMNKLNKIITEIA